MQGVKELKCHYRDFLNRNDVLRIMLTTVAPYHVKKTGECFGPAELHYHYW